MARREMPAPDTSRKMVQSKIFNGNVYTPGMENRLPAGFPMDGEHWDDYLPEPKENESTGGLVAEIEAERKAAQGEPAPQRTFGGPRANADAGRTFPVDDDEQDEEGEGDEQEQDEEQGEPELPAAPRVDLPTPRMPGGGTRAAGKRKRGTRK